MLTFVAASRFRNTEILRFAQDDELIEVLRFTQDDGNLMRAIERRDSNSMPHSHSIVPGGFEVMSYTTRLMPFTSFTIRLDICFSTS